MVVGLCAGHLLLLSSGAFVELDESNLFHQCTVLLLITEGKTVEVE